LTARAIIDPPCPRTRTVIRYGPPLALAGRLHTLSCKYRT
jgi:hypothetical protein